MSAAYAGPPSTTGSGIQPDPVAIRDWLRWWFEHCDQGDIEIAWTDPSDGSVNRAKHFPICNLQHAADFAALQNAIPGVNVYFNCSTVRVPFTENERRRAKDSQAVQTPGLWADQDTDEHVSKLHAAEPILQPSAVIVTGDHPTRRQHTYLRFDAPIAPQDVKPLNQRLLRLYGGGAESVNPARVLRLPGCIAWPYKAGRQIERVYCEPRPAPSYSLQRVEFALPEIPQQPVADAPTTPSVRQTAQEIIDSIRPGHWHPPVMRLVASMIDAGLPDAMIHLIDEQITLPGWDIEQTRADVQKLIDSGRQRFNRPEGQGLLPDRAGEAADAFAGAPLTLLSPGGGWQPIPDTGIVTQGIGDIFRSRGTPPDWLIEGFVPESSTVMVTGLPGVGKSPLVQYWVALLAAGGQWLGQSVQPTKVLYWAAESVGQTARNVALFLADLEGPDTDPQSAADTMNERIRVLDTAGLTLEHHAPAIAAYMDTVEDGFGALVIDTLRASSVGGVTKDEDMRAVQAAVAGLRAGRPRLTVILIHHSSKGDPEGASGSNRLEGMADVLLNMTALAPAKGKDASDDKYSVANKLVWSGEDADGWKHAKARLIAPRVKQWSSPDPLHVRLSNRDGDLRLTVGPEAEGALPFGDAPLDSDGAFAAPPKTYSPQEIEDAACWLMSLDPSDRWSFGRLGAALQEKGVLSDKSDAARSKPLRSALDRLVEKKLVATEGSARWARYWLNAT